MRQSRAYRFKAMLDVGGAQSFARFGGGCRWLWNRLLHLNKERYERDGKFIFYHEMTALLPGLNKDFPWLTEVPAAALQRVCRNLDKALKDCFQKGRGFPRPKRKKDLADAFYMTNQQVTTVVRTGKRAGLLSIPKVGEVKVRGGRWPFADEELERIGANLFPKVTSATARRDGGDWYVAVQVEVDVLDPETPTVPVAAAADLGLKDLATLNDGTVLPNPRRLRKAEKRLRRKQRQVSRARKGSKNRRKRVMALSRLHAKVRRFRHGYIHQFTSWLTTKADVVCVEDLAVKALMRTRMAKSLSDAAWGEIVRQLTYKAGWKGKWAVEIDRWLPSSQACSGCGQVHPEMRDLKVRRMVCDCGVDLDRDHNAALNILRWGLEVWREKVGQGMAEPTPLGVYACGEPSAGAGNVVPFATGPARHGSGKQELKGTCATQDLVSAA